MKSYRLLLLLAALGCTATASTFAADNAMVGTWKLDESKSKIAADGPKNETVTWAEKKDGVMMLTVDGMDKDGKKSHWTWTGKFDGEQHKAKGIGQFDTIAYKMVDDHTLSGTGMKDGKEVFTGTVKVKPDGKTRVVTITTTGDDGKKHTSKSYYTKE